VLPIDPSKRVDWSEFKDELHNVLTSVSSKTEREWPTTVGTPQSHVIVLGHFRISLAAYETIRYFCAELPRGDSARKPEFIVSAPPLIRSVLDALANIIYLFEDIGARTLEFSRRAWKEDNERAARFRRKYGTDPAWSDFFAHLDELDGRTRASLGISEADARELRRWPTLGAMISTDPRGKDRLKDDARRLYLTYLNDWFYRDFSSDTHLSPPGFFRRVELVMHESRLWTEREWAAAGALRTQVLTATIGLMLAMSAELQNEFKFGMAERITRIWSRLNFYSPDLKELYEQRARNLLTT
jgi:hypothetical protein